jgi:hypothetical protein
VNTWRNTFFERRHFDTKLISTGYHFVRLPTGNFRRRHFRWPATTRGCGRKSSPENNFRVETIRPDDGFSISGRVKQPMLLLWQKR